MSEKLWAGRFKEKTAKIVETFTSSIDVDRRLYAYDIQGSIAHCRTLAKAAIISAEEAEELITGLEKIKQEIDEGTLPYSDALEDIHTHIESRLAEVAGKVAHKLHTARSRNDQVALDVRLYLRDTVLSISQHLSELQNVLVGLAKRQLTENTRPNCSGLRKFRPTVSIPYPTGILLLSFYPPPVFA
jgi:argininosuccinate lyase